MRIAILGASGLIGHKLFERLSARFGDVTGILHGGRDDYGARGLFAQDRTIANVDVRDFDQLCGILHAIGPDVVLNCVGITKRRPQVNEPMSAITVNSLFPHRLARWAGEHGKRMIHFSTDCVFDGATGDYTEESPTTAKDAYGRTKALGEIDYPHTLTIRSSFVGRELTVRSELLEWFLAQKGRKIRGFTQAYYSGVSTIEMTRVVGDIIERHPQLSGLRQLAMPAPISKYDLLCVAREAFGLDVDIEPDAGFVSRPTLDGSRLRSEIGVTLPSWPEMMDAIAADAALYPKP